MAGEVIYYGDPQAPINLTQLDPGGKAIRQIRWGEIAMIFQEPMTSLSPVHTIGNQMIEAIRLHLHVSKNNAAQRAVELLGRVGLAQPERLLSRYRHELSGGMRQRVMIAIALSCNPKLLIADEPTTAVDVTTQAQILNLMRDLQQEFGMAILFITHALGVIAEMAENVVVMYLGEEVELADVDTLYYNTGHPYTQALLRSIPRHDTRLNRLETIEGNVPDPLNMPTGCKFHPRCAHYVPAQCDRDSLPLVKIGHQHWVRCVRSAEIRPQLVSADQTERAL